MPTEQIHFLTGRLAESSVRETVQSLATELGFEATVQVLPISVAALMTVEWIASRLTVPAGTNRVMIPGYCQGSTEQLSALVGVPVQRGPKDIRALSQCLGQQMNPIDLSTFDIEIIAEVNLAPRMDLEQVVATGRTYAEAGADIIDLGTVPGECCLRIGEYVRALRDNAWRVSIDSMDIQEISSAVRAGAELVLSVNHTNRHAAEDWGCEVVVIPDDHRSLATVQDTIEYLDAKRIPFRLDPILEPIGLGFAHSLARYIEARQRWPHLEIMMGIGNITELTDVDSAGTNLLLLGICQELGIRSVLTTQVINWARSSIAECDLARRIVYYACRKQLPPKNVSDQLVMLRDPRLLSFSEDQVDELARNIKDPNYRILTTDNAVHLLGSGNHFHGEDVFRLFDELAATNPKNLTPAHAFYLGFELCKALTAVQLGKNYVQDESLHWGHLTVPESNRHRIQRTGHRA